MSEFAKPVVTLDDARAFLDAHHGHAVEGLEAFGTGYWSAAFGYEVHGEALVARFGRNREWFEVDRAAYAYNADTLPVPRVREIGEVDDGVIFAISERKYGLFLEDTPAESAGQLRPLVDGLLDALGNAPASPEPPGYSWRGWLLDNIDGQGRNAPWRARVAEDAVAGPIAARAETTATRLLDAVPEKRELVHGDLLHKNVLVAPDVSRITAVFSWKCSTRGDALFDLAWLTFWSPWFDGIAALNLQPAGDEAVRHRCYELCIGLNHLSWFAQIEDQDNLRRVAGELERRLDER